MVFPKDRRVIIGGGVAFAMLAGLGLAVFLNSGEEQKAPPPASQAGLVVDVGREDDVKAKNPLRCFVNGQFVGLLMLADCAQRNGVATTALDVGLDETGALAAAETLGTTLTPLPPDSTTAIAAGAPVSPPIVIAPAPTDAAAPRVPTATCQRYDRTWGRIGELSLNACVRALFEGRCERPGSAAYGRWGDQTLRLVTGRVEVSPDDRAFRTLVDQGPNCSLPPL